MNDLAYLIVPVILGAVLGSSIFHLIFVARGKGDIGIAKSVVGSIGGGFLGSFAGMLLALGFPVLSEWPYNLWTSTITSTIFAVALQVYIRNNIGD